MNISRLIRFIMKRDRERDKKIVPPKPMPFSQEMSMSIDLVAKKNKK